MTTTYPRTDVDEVRTLMACSLTDRRLDRIIAKTKRLPDHERTHDYWTPDQWKDVHTMVDLDVDRVTGDDLYHRYYGLVAQ
jgi:hypothetical protein